MVQALGSQRLLKSDLRASRRKNTNEACRCTLIGRRQGNYRERLKAPPTSQSAQDFRARTPRRKAQQAQRSACQWGRPAKHYPVEARENNKATRRRSQDQTTSGTPTSSSRSNQAGPFLRKSENAPKDGYDHDGPDEGRKVRIDVLNPDFAKIP